MRVSYPAAFDGGFLETTTNPENAGAWEPIGAGGEAVGGEIQVTIPRREDKLHRFFRLRLR